MWNVQSTGHSKVTHLQCMIFSRSMTRLPNDRILNRLFNGENNWIDVRFGIGSRIEVNNICTFFQFVLIFFETVIEKPENVMQPPKDRSTFAEFSDHML